MIAPLNHPNWNAIHVNARSGTPQAGQTPAATPSGSNASLVEQMLVAATPSGSNASLAERMLVAATPSGSNARAAARRLGLTPEGSQTLEKCPHAATTLKGSQPEFRVRDRSGKPAGPDSYRDRGLEADSPTALHLSAGTPTLRLRSGRANRQAQCNEHTHQAIVSPA